MHLKPDEGSERAGSKAGSGSEGGREAGRDCSLRLINLLAGGTTRSHIRQILPNFGLNYPKFQKS